MALGIYPIFYLLKGDYRAWFRVQCFDSLKLARVANTPPSFSSPFEPFETRNPLFRDGRLVDAEEESLLPSFSSRFRLFRGFGAVRVSGFRV